jgi:hypothetical protein
MTPQRRRLHLECLEARDVPAFTSVLSGTTATMTGSVNNDSLTVSVSAGLLTHDRGTDPGFAGGTDWDSSAAGTQTLSAAVASVLIIDLLNGADSFTLVTGGTNMTAAVHGGAGNDSFTISATSGGNGANVTLLGEANDDVFNLNGVGPASFTLNVDGGADFDRAVLAPAQSIVFNPADAASGSIDYTGVGNAPDLSYFGMDFFRLITPAANLQFNIPPATIALLSDDGSVGDPDNTQDAGASFIIGTGITATQFVNPAVSLTVSAGGGNTVSMFAMDANFAPTSGTFIIGGTAADTFTVVPDNNSPILVDGNGPATIPGDVLNLPTVNPQPGLGLPNGTAGNLTYQDFETLNVSYDDVQFAVGADRGGGPLVQYYDPNGNRRWVQNAFAATFTGGVRVASEDFTGDGLPDVVVGTGPGAPTLVRILDGSSQNEIFHVAPFESTFTGGVYVAAGDITGDGIPELVITPDEGGGPRVRIFNGAGFGLLGDFLGIDDTNFRGGARAAIGDITGDGRGDLIVAAGFGGGPRVTGFDGTTVLTGSRAPMFNFFLFEPALRNGAFIATGDLNGDGFEDLIGGGGPGGGPRVYALSGIQIPSQGASAAVLANFFGGDVNSRGGIRVATRHFDADTKADLVVGAGSGAGSRVTGYLGANIAPSGTPPVFLSFDAFPGFSGGVFVE